MDGSGHDEQTIRNTSAAVLRRHGRKKTQIRSAYAHAHANGGQLFVAAAGAADNPKGERRGSQHFAITIIVNC